MTKDYFTILVTYICAGVGAVLVGDWAEGWDPVWTLAAADLAGTVIVFGFSLLFDNSSFYDPYWSVAPIGIAAFWLFFENSGSNMGPRQWIVVILVLVWGIRLTLNWAVRWRGIGHEDWRYADRRKMHGKLYWPVSFLGIHLTPTILVFLGCLPLISALGRSGSGFGILDILAALITAAAITIEARADFEVTRFSQDPANRGKLLVTGLWSLSRHPNYFGEITFWWGLYLFGLAADPNFWWTVTGPISITLLFVFISIPMIEKRMLARRPEYASYMQNTSMLIPWR